MSGRVKLAAWISIYCLAYPGIAHAQQQVVGAPPEAQNMKLVGTSDLQARSAYQPTIHHQGDRWIAYIGHHGGTDDIPSPVNPQTGKAEPNGTSIVDVTDPSQPKYLRHIPGQEGTYEAGGAQMVRICDGKALPKGDRNAVYTLRTFGGEAHEIWNVADPANPVLITRIAGLKDTHKNFWECDTGIAFLVSGAPDWRTRRMTQVYDLSDPAHPQKIRDFGLPGQEPGSTGAVPTELHGPISTGPSGNRVYFGYGTNKGGFLQIVDREKLLNGPKQPTPDNLRSPEISRMPMSAFNGAHTTFPMPGMPIAEFAHDKDGNSRDIVMIVDEAILNECNEPRQMVWFADVTVENRPMMISSYTVPEASGSFCGGEGGSARIPPARAWRRSITRRWPSSPSSTPACARSTFAIPITRPKSAISFRRSRRRPTSAASPVRARIAARSRSRPIMSRPMSAAISTSSIAPTPACIFWN